MRPFNLSPCGRGRDPRGSGPRGAGEGNSRRVRSPRQRRRDYPARRCSRIAEGGSLALPAIACACSRPPFLRRVVRRRPRRSAALQSIRNRRRRGPRAVGAGTSIPRAEGCAKVSTAFARPGSNFCATCGLVTWVDYIGFPQGLRSTSSNRPLTRSLSLATSPVRRFRAGLARNFGDFFPVCRNYNTINIFRRSRRFYAVNNQRLAQKRPNIFIRHTL